jgi:hypothetical protein
MHRARRASPRTRQVPMCCRTSGRGTILEVVSKPRFGRLRGKDPLSKRGGDESRTDGRPVGPHFPTDPEAASEAQGWTASGRRSLSDGRHSLGAAQWGAVARYARPIPRVRDVLAPTRRVGTRRSLALALASVSQGSR